MINFTRISCFSAALLGLIAWAAPGVVHATAAVEWQLGLPQPATPVMEDIVFFHDWILMPIITAITLFVLALLLYVMWRFSEKRNPKPSKTTHNTVLEVLWTAIPVLILVVIAVPSFQLLYKEDIIPKADMTMKVGGHQWYWSYEYPDQGDFRFDSFMIAEDELEPGQLRNLEVDYRAVVPVDTTIRVMVTASDVLHNFAMPAFGLKMDAVPGRVNETWFHAQRTGVFYGQCSELCGPAHAYMPIVIEVVEPEEFEAWAELAQAEFAEGNPPPSVGVVRRMLAEREQSITKAQIAEAGAIVSDDAAVGTEAENAAR